MQKLIATQTLLVGTTTIKSAEPFQLEKRKASVLIAAGMAKPATDKLIKTEK